MKIFVKLITLLALVSILVGCGGTPAAPTQDVAEAPAAQATEAPVAEATEAPAAESSLSEAEQWAMDNEVGPYTPETEDWAAIEAAAILEGSVVVYSNSSKIEKLLEPWAELYPEIKLEGGDTDDIAVKMGAEQQAGNVVGDVWFNTEIGAEPEFPCFFRHFISQRPVLDARLIRRGFLAADAVSIKPLYRAAKT